MPIRAPEDTARQLPPTSYRPLGQTQMPEGLGCKPRAQGRSSTSMKTGLIPETSCPFTKISSASIPTTEPLTLKTQLLALYRATT